MGGAVFLLLAAAEMKRRQDEELRRQQIRREKERKNNQKKSYESYSYTPRYSFDEHIRGIVLDNSDYLDYVKKVYEEGFEIDKQDQKEIEDKIEPMIPGFADAEKKIEELKKQIEDSGIEVSSKQGYISSMRIGKEESYTRMRVGGHIFESSGYPNTFNGIKINKTILDEDGKQYQEQYDSHLATYPNLDGELEELKRALERQERIQKIPLMNTYNRQQKIAELKKDISTHERDIETRQKREKELEAYKNLTPEQKDLIRQYLDAIDAAKKVEEPIAKLVHEHVGITRRYTQQEIDRNRWERAEASVLTSGKVTEEQAKAFNDMITEELKDPQSSYDKGVRNYEGKAGEALGRMGPLEWMIKVRSIEFARAEKARLKEEEKTLDEAVALTEERDKAITASGVTTTALEDKEKSDKEKEAAKEAEETKTEDKKDPVAEEEQRKDAAEYAEKEEKEGARDEQE